MNKKSLLMITLLFVFLFAFQANASTKIKGGTIKQVSENEKTIKFKLNDDSAESLEFSAAVYDGSAHKNEKLRVSLYDSDWEEIYHETLTKKKLPDGMTGTYTFWVSSVKILPAGTYYYVFESLGTHSFSIKYQIYSSSAYAKSLKPGKSKHTVEAGKEKIIKYSTVPSKGLVLYEDITVDNPDVAEAYWYGLSSQELAVFGLKPGTAKITVKLDKGKKVTFTVKVTEAKKPYFDYKNYYLYTGEKINNWFYGGKTVTWSSGNKKIATVDKSGNVTGKTVGKTKITAKTNGKSYSYNLIVQRREPNFAAKVTAYYTRDNYFTVKIRNLGARPLTIKSGIKVENVDYKSFDRNVRLKKAVTIPKGKTKTVRFYVKGTNTWYDYADYTLFYKFVYDGKEYEGHVWYDDSVFKKPDKKWYTTYWEKDDELEIY